MKHYLLQYEKDTNKLRAFTIYDNDKTIEEVEQTVTDYNKNKDCNFLYQLLTETSIVGIDTIKQLIDKKALSREEIRRDMQQIQHGFEEIASRLEDFCEEYK